jgi:hypothetical protein
MAEFDRVGYFSNVVRHVEELNAKYKVVDIPLVLGDFLIVIDAINDKDAEVEDQILASLVFATNIFRVRSCFFPLCFKGQKARPDPEVLWIN